MLRGDRTERLQKESNKLYALLGKFVVKFQIICFQLEQGILFMSGLRNQSAMRAALVEMTAQPLLDTYRSIASDTHNLHVLQPETLLNIVNRVQSLITQRNEILHGTWFIGWSAENETDFSFAVGLKGRHTKVGVRQKELGISADEFKPLISECELVSELVNRLSLAVMTGLDFAKNFTVVDGFVSVPQHLSRVKSN